MIDKESFITKDELISINSKTEYFFQRTYLLLDENTYAELVAISVETDEVDGHDLIHSYDVIATDDREEKIFSLPRNISTPLIKDKVIREIIPLNKKQCVTLQSQYKDNLFLIDEHLIKSIS